MSLPLACGISPETVIGTFFKNDDGDEFLAINFEGRRNYIEKVHLIRWPEGGKVYYCDYTHHKQPHTRAEADYYATGQRLFSALIASCFKTTKGEYRCNPSALRF